MFNYKRAYYFEGINCIAPMDNATYEAGRKISQGTVAWADQPRYGKYTVYFGIVVIFIATVKHVWFLQRDYFYKKRPSSNVATSIVDVFVAYSRYLGYKQVSVSLTRYTSMPSSVGSSLVMFVSALYMLCYCFIPHFWYRDCLLFGSPPMAVRAGIMAGAMTPFLYVLAGKTNMVSFLTGISYEKLNVFHQYVGFATLVLALIHTIPFIYQPLAEGGSHNLYRVFHQIAYYSGIPPLALILVLSISSKAIVRKYIYEVFWHTHWVCAIAYFGTLIWHINKTLNIQNYMWGALAFWATQLIYRILVKTAFKPNSLFLRPRKAQLRKLNSDTFEVTVASTEGYKWKPGQHCYLRFSGYRLLDNHPFSISSVSDNENQEMKFIIVPMRGLTRVLFEQLEDFVVTEKLVYLDGPYGGTPRDPTTFERVVLLATGSGVTATLPYLTMLSNNIRDSTEEGTRLPLITRGINFIWVVKHTDDVSWVRTELDRCQEIAGDYINIDIYVTRDNEDLPEKIAGAPEGVQIEKTSETLEREFSRSSNDHHFKIHHFKPNFGIILENLKTSFSRRNLIVSSGSDSMKRIISSEASRLQPLIFNNDLNRNSIEEIYLHTESFGW